MKEFTYADNCDIIQYYSLKWDLRFTLSLMGFDYDDIFNIMEGAHLGEVLWAIREVVW